MTSDTPNLHDAAPPAPVSVGPHRWLAWAAALASALVPGLGQLARGRIGDGVLILALAGWLHLFLAGQVAAGARTAAFIFGAPAAEGGLRAPVFVVFTVLMIALHGFAAIDAWRAYRPPTSAERRDDQSNATA